MFPFIISVFLLNRIIIIAFSYITQRDFSDQYCYTMPLDSPLYSSYNNFIQINAVFKRFDVNGSLMA